MKKTRFLTQGAVIAAAYAALCYAFMPISYGGVQFRIAEGLTLLPLLFPAAVPGLFVGCILANLASPYFLIDVVFGSIATLIGAAGTYFIGKKVESRRWKLALAPLCPILANTFIVGGILTYSMIGTPDELPFLVLAGQVFAGELVVCYALGIPLILAFEKIRKR